MTDLVKFAIDRTILYHFIGHGIATYILSPVFGWFILRVAIPLFSFLAGKREDSFGIRAFAFSNMRYIKVSVAGIFIAWIGVNFVGGFMIEFDQMLKAPLGPTHYFNPLDWLAGIVGGTVAAAFQFKKMRD